MDLSILFLIILLLLSLAIFFINRKRNAWDILFFNFTLGILALFMVGILSEDVGVWKHVAIGLIIILTGEKLVGFFVEK